MVQSWFIHSISLPARPLWWEAKVSPSVFSLKDN